MRFVQVYHGTGGNAWDAHKDLKKTHAEQAAKVDKPIAGLMKDLKQRGMLDDTLVVWATEFGRTPGGEGANGRDHNPYGFSVWMAGAGIKKGMVHGATDELGFNAVENRHYVTDIHATVFRQMGIDPRRFKVPGPRSAWISTTATRSKRFLVNVLVIRGLKRMAHLSQSQKDPRTVPAV